MLSYSQLGEDTALYETPFKFRNAKHGMRNIDTLEEIWIGLKGIKPGIPGHRCQIFLLLEYLRKCLVVFSIRIGQGVNGVHAVPFHQQLGQLYLIPGSIDIHLRKRQMVGRMTAEYPSAGPRTYSFPCQYRFPP